MRENEKKTQRYRVTDRDSEKRICEEQKQMEKCERNSDQPLKRQRKSKQNAYE